MGSYRLKEEYDIAFATFLRHTNEKEVLLREIETRIRRAGATSMLDIGAGNGELAVPLARLVGKYLAVEQKPTYANVLQEAGLRVLQESFPVAIERQFDLVVVSHALPYRATDYGPFLNCAWACVAPSGSLLCITYDPAHSEWGDLRSDCGFPAKTSWGEERLETLEAYLSVLGPTSVDVVTTHVSASSVAQMLSALSFVYSDGEPGKAALFREQSGVLTDYLDMHYRIPEGYRFPFQHVFLQTQKR